MTGLAIYCQAGLGLDGTGGAVRTLLTNLKIPISSK